MGHKHTKEDILEGALAAALDEGLSQLTFGRLAKRLRISDRTVVYYFPTKDALVGEVILSMGLRLQATLAEAFATPAADHLELVGRAWPVLSADEHAAFFALFFESMGLAAAGREPYRTLVPQLVEAWIEWAASFIEAPPRRRRAEAEAAIVIVDGLILLRQLSGPESASRAARLIGVR